MVKRKNILGVIAAIAIMFIWLIGCSTSETEGTKHIDHVTTVQEFRERVLQADKPVLVDFYATWCPPCKLLAPTIGELANEYAGRVEFIKVDGDKSPKLVSEYRIEGYPTVLIFKGGKPAKKLVGLRHADEYRRAMDSLIN